MPINNFAVYGVKIFTDVIKDILYFPFWWYSRGTLEVARGLFNFLATREKSLALFIWIKNIHRPMYGQSDWQGMLISFFMRLIQIIFRSAILFFWLIISLALLLLWIIFPILAIYGIYFQLFFNLPVEL